MDMFKLQAWIVEPSSCAHNPCAILCPSKKSLVPLYLAVQASLGIYNAVLLWRNRYLLAGLGQLKSNGWRT